jgi:methionine-rich copper-binding protein CopC
MTTTATPRRPRAAVIGVFMVLFGIVFAAVAPSAAAHNALISSNPAADSVIPTSPTSVELVFNQEVKDFQPKIAITINGHDPIEIVPTVDGPTVTADLTTVELPGSDSTEPVSWRVGYRIVSADGHPVAGLLDFSVGSGPAPTMESAGESAAATTSVDSDAASQSESGGANWWWIGGAVVAVAVVIALVVALRGRRPVTTATDA